MFTELLPETKSEKHGAITWERATDNALSQVAGVLTISGARSWCRYRVEEFVPGWDGRAFVLVKADAGSDPSEDRYTCFIARNGQDRQCTCKGFSYGGACRHLAALVALIENGQI